MSSGFLFRVPSPSGWRLMTLAVSPRRYPRYLLPVLRGTASPDFAEFNHPGRASAHLSIHRRR